MSKYNRYAKQLDEAFKASRQEYTAAWDALQAAQKASAEAQEWRKEQYVGENDLRRQRAKSSLLEAEHAFKAAENRIWPEFNRKRQELRTALGREIKGDGRATPDAIDPNGLELLKSGILTPDDYFSLVDRYDNNPTMLRLVAKYAREAADDMTDDRAGQGALLQVAHVCKDGQSGVLRAWDELSSVADYCSGQAHGRKEDPGYVVSMGKWWEQLAGKVVENF